MDHLRSVKFFATTKHDGQRYGVLPYTHHLWDVDQVLLRFGITDLIMRSAAWLHDVVEDTPTKIKEIVELFGPEVAGLVQAVTNEKAENRKVRTALTYPKILAYPRAVQLKLADRIANVENGGDLVDMYKKEYESFRRALHTPGLYEDMWKHLDSLLDPGPSKCV